MLVWVARRVKLKSRASQTGTPNEAARAALQSCQRASQQYSGPVKSQGPQKLASGSEIILEHNPIAVALPYQD